MNNHEILIGLLRRISLEPAASEAREQLEQIIDAWTDRHRRRTELMSDEVRRT